MIISKAVELGKMSIWAHACARINPSDTSQWYIMLTDRDKKTHMLVDDNEVPLTSESLNAFIPTIKKLGLKTFEVVI